MRPTSLLNVVQPRRKLLYLPLNTVQFVHLSLSQVYLALQIFVPLFLLTFPFYRALGLLVMLRRRCHFRGVLLRLSCTLSIAFLQANSGCFQMAIGY